MLFTLDLVFGWQSLTGRAARVMLTMVPLPVAAPSVPLPNIIFMLTDDQDQTLGGSFPAHNHSTAMPRTKVELVDKGAMATNHFIHTPICCPSRSETLTGRYLHNVKLPVNTGPPQCTDGYTGHDDAGNACCMHVDESLVNNYTFAKPLHDAGYLVGMFGKYLNVCPLLPPPGFDVWYANGGSTYYSPFFNVFNVPGLESGPSNTVRMTTRPHSSETTASSSSRRRLSASTARASPFWRTSAPRPATTPFNQPLGIRRTGKTIGRQSRLGRATGT